VAGLENVLDGQLDRETGAAQRLVAVVVTVD
jgi:hypothetical protein